MARGGRAVLTRRRSDAAGGEGVGDAAQCSGQFGMSGVEVHRGLADPFPQTFVIIVVDGALHLLAQVSGVFVLHEVQAAGKLFQLSAKVHVRQIIATVREGRGAGGGPGRDATAGGVRDVGARTSLRCNRSSPPTGP